jgi:hypothetical protein
MPVLEETHDSEAIIRYAGTSFKRCVASGLQRTWTFIAEPFVDECEAVAEINSLRVGLNWTTPR